MSTISQTSKYGVFRTGLWYEWATTNRYQIPSNPLARYNTGSPLAVPGSQLDSALPNFHENFWTNSYQPYAEFEWHVLPKFQITGGTKYAYYKMDLKQYADNGKTVGYLNGPGSFVNELGGVPQLAAVGGLQLPDQAELERVLRVRQGRYYSAEQRVRCRPDHGGRRGEDASRAFGHLDLPGRIGGEVQAVHHRWRLLLHQVPELVHQRSGHHGDDGDDYYLGPDSLTKGFETEANLYLGHGLSLYGNGSATKATYRGTGVPSGLWVAGTPANIEGFGLLYQAKNIDAGFFHKRVGPQVRRQRGPTTTRTTTRPFNIDNFDIGYTVRNDSKFDRTKFAVTFNNLLDTRNVTSINVRGQAGGGGRFGILCYFGDWRAGDLLTQTPGRGA